ncbi:murein L,D-transpeptidase [Azoarcus sp. DD4]|uniref:L,D-transpeptidase family protein n=1 Tax=Azoarcus sp. DD4 TaxID=2027405 RepID=UPI00197A7023|nr:L,D-transpeptidase family protein [Azoarcus sp. DD4]
MSDPSPIPTSVRRFRRAAAAVLCVLGLAWQPAMAQSYPQWLEGGRPSTEAARAVDILSAAADDGLEPQDYGAEALAQALEALHRDGDLAGQAEFESRLTAAMERYLADLHGGRIDPRRLHETFDVALPDSFDAAAYLRDAVAAGRLAEAAKAAAPRLPLYAELRTALAAYRRLAADPAVRAAWQAPLPPPPRRKLEPGQSYAGLAAVLQRLVALGDLPQGTLLPARYEGALVEGVKAFQQRHGLATDGVLGKATIAQLEVVPAARARQTALTMERLRWTPLLQAPRMIVVNVPEFMLRAYAVRDGRIEIKAQMKVIVGKALDTRTPLLAEDMRFIEFSPYWNVPPSIARAETVPRLHREPAYWAQQGFEFVDGDGRAITALSVAGLDAVLRGELRIRQRPGPKNALGDIKFIFPNNDNIYLHHTPAPQLFARERRDFSHGCIRVEDPVALAKFVLAGDPAWDETRIREAMEAGKSRTLRLAEPLPVLIAYGTALVKQDGRTYFFPDIYGHDALLDEALRNRGRPDPAVARR